MSKYFQTGLILLYVLLTGLTFLLVVELSEVAVPEAIAWLGIAGWLSFCFLSAYFITGLYLLFHGRFRKPILAEEKKLQHCLEEVLLKASCDRSFRLMIEE